MCRSSLVGLVDSAGIDLCHPRASAWRTGFFAGLGALPPLQISTDTITNPTMVRNMSVTWRGRFFRYFFRSLLYFCARLVCTSRGSILWLKVLSLCLARTLAQCRVVVRIPTHAAPSWHAHPGKGGRNGQTPQGITVKVTYTKYEECEGESGGGNGVWSG